LKGSFTVDAESFAELKAEFDKRGEIVIDWEHQSLGGEYQRPDGRAPAAGWIKSIRYEKGVGVIAACAWSKEARALIRDGQYKFWSPAIQVSKKGNKAIGLNSAGLTNMPAIYDMPRLAASDRPQEIDMKTFKVDPAMHLRSILVALQEGEGDLPTAISEDQAAMVRLVDVLKGLGVSVGDDATLAQLINEALPFLTEGGEGEPEGGDEEGMSAKDAEALRAELGIDEKGDIMATVKELKAEQATLVLKAGTAENAEARLKELEAAEAARVEAKRELVLSEIVEAGHILPDDEKAMKAARLVLSTHGEDTLRAIYSGSAPIHDPRQLVTAGAVAQARDKRSKLIALTAKEWETDKSRGKSRCSTYVNVALTDDEQSVLTADEAAKIDGKDGA